MTDNSHPENGNIKLTIAKFSVLILSSLLFMVGITIVFKAASFEKQASAVTKTDNTQSKEKNISISAYDIKNVYSCGGYLCLIAQNKTSPRQKIVIINPADINDIKYINLQ